MTALSVDQLIARVFTSPHVKAEAVYTIADVAALLNVEKDVVLQLIKGGDIKARKIAEEYRILGSNIMNFLNT